MTMTDDRPATVPDVLPLDAVGLADLATVGGKNASLGEMLRELGGLGVRVPDGFATTAAAFRRHVEHTGLAAWITSALDGLDVEDTAALAATGAAVRRRVLATPLERGLEQAVRDGFAD